ncbi:MAG TPA: glycosyltransferase family A protein [Caulobacteraceae bacterium]|jgi:glycosyltransferase involved in cell wall biosynthesis
MAVTPLVSVLIPCFNAEAWVAETLDSVLAQSWPSLEIIVVDDGSTDRSAAIIADYADRGVTLIRQTNQGTSAARNRAFAASSGDFIQHLDADDVLDPEKIERQVARLADASDCVCTGEAGCFVGAPEDTLFRPLATWLDLDPLDWLARNFEPCMIIPIIWLVPRALALEVGPWVESIVACNDREYFTRLVLASRRVLFASGARCRYRVGNPRSLSQHMAWSSTFETLDRCEAQVRAREDSERVRRVFAIDWQDLAHAAYPYDAILAERALDRARDLHSFTIGPGGGPKFRLASLLLGWRAARRLQVMCGGR